MALMTITPPSPHRLRTVYHACFRGNQSLVLASQGNSADSYRLHTYEFTTLLPKGRTAAEISYLSRNRETAFSRAGFHNWQKALQRFREHATSHSHLFAAERVSQHAKAPSISTQLSRKLASHQKCARVCLEATFLPFVF